MQEIIQAANRQQAILTFWRSCSYLETCRLFEKMDPEQRQTAINYLRANRLKLPNLNVMVETLNRKYIKNERTDHATD
jgi:hypothetical protein